jgi:putative membrane protein
MARWTIAGAVVAALALAPAARAADDKETKRESAATSASGTAAGSTSTAGDTARGAMNQEPHNAKSTPPDATGAAPATATGSSSAPSKHDNTDVIQKLWSSNVLEVEAAKVAKDNAQSDDVKEFAKRMEKDHGEMRDALAMLADDRNLKLEEDQALRAHEAHLDGMKDMKGAKFDAHYTSMMVKHHDRSKKDVDAALKRAKQSGDHELAEVLQSAKTKIAEHQRVAKSLGKSDAQRMGRRPTEAAGSAEHGAERAGDAAKDATR